MEKSRAIELLEHLAWDRDIERNPYGDALNMAIEALKAQLFSEGTTSDLISRTETVEHLRRMLEATVPNTDYDEGYVDGVEFGISTVSTMPTIQPEPQWIPVSERLPKIGEYVLCYLKSRRYFGHYRVCIYRAADKYINHPYFDFNENGFPDVIAWMPLPEPYKPNK